MNNALVLLLLATGLLSPRESGPIAGAESNYLELFKSPIILDLPSSIRMLPPALLLFLSIPLLPPHSSAIPSSTKSVHYVVQEECGPGTYIGNPIQDANIQINSKQPLTFKIMYGKQEVFDLNETTGDLRTNQHLDREVLCAREPRIRRKIDRPPLKRLETIKVNKEIRYANVIASSSATPQKCQVETSIVVYGNDKLSETWINVYLTVQDLNDNRPFFEDSYWNLTISESTSVGTTFQLPQAIDPDEGENSILRYGLVDESSPNCRNRFSITCQSEIVSCHLRLVVEKAIDFETCQNHDLILFAEDSGQSDAVLPFHINIKGENEFPPQFIQPATKLTILRDSQIGTTITTFHVVDKDGGEDGEVTFLTNSSYFRVTGGKLILSRSLLSYPGKQMNVFVTAIDGGNPQQQSTVEVAIEITGQEAELQPDRIFIKPLGGEAISGVEAPVILPNAAEKDTLVALVWTENGASNIGCSIQPELPHFAIENAGHLMGKPTFTLKVSRSYNFSENYNVVRNRIEHRDVRILCGGSHLNLRMRLAPPPGQQFRFTHDNIRLSIEESSSPIIGFYTLRTVNGIGEVHFSKERGLPECDRMYINPHDGTLSLPGGIDREVTSELKCHFSAFDSDDPVNRIQISVMVIALDINDCSPSLIKEHYFLPEFDSFFKPPDPSTWVPLFKLDALDSDAGLNGTIKYDLRSVKTFGNGSTYDRIPEFRLSVDSGEVFIKGTDYPLLDREEISVIVLFIFLCDMGSPFRLSAEYEVRVTLEDVNDNVPIFFDAESDNVLQNMPWYRSIETVPGFWTQIRIFDPDLEENGTTVLSILDKPFMEDDKEPYLRPHQVTLFKDGRLWVPESLTKHNPVQAVYLRVIDKGSRRQLHSEAKLIVDPEIESHKRNQLKRPMYVYRNAHRAGKYMERRGDKNSHSMLSRVHIILIVVGVSLICFILISIWVACIVLQN
nr:protocadherin alpha 4 unspliced [Hymenolepis microstoma]